MCFPKVFFSFFEITRVAVKSKSVQLRPTHVIFWVGREGNNVVCLEFGSSLMLFMAANCCSCSGGFVPFQPTFL